ncbi:DNA/RNA non-specific endonuclease [Deinococcus sp. KNUC1210]|uniref:DNA/RNA non-specific endonuclease n=1 Tax=Deinococcus sp. KNUC1210 TaxID=2917691 RepID=UPI001EEF923B|nr:DNA/RNA non-specific endonuclease [Deinococcus sp. KNUC1210]ULH15876.1 DNA/RNA non-specific endonuclease [Deinococcus sp. KNUC1210]
MTSRLLRTVPTVVVVLLGVLAACQKNAGQSGQSGGDACTDEFRAGQPTSSVSGTRLLCREQYIALYDPARKVPLVVGEHLETSELDGSEGRTNNFAPDPELPSGERAELADFRNSGYDRGHMAPAADFHGGETEMSQSFYLSNMVPQNPELNRGLWAGLEGATRNCAKTVGGLYILTGPIFEGRARTIGPDRVAVPSSVYKIVVSGNAARAFLVPNRSVPKTSNFSRYETTVDEIQTASGLVFFPKGGVNTQQRGDFCAGSYGG